MESDRIRKAESIFHELLDAPGDARADRLQNRCAGDPELRGLVEQMLANDHSGMGGFLVQPIYLRTEERISTDDPQISSIGGYEIVRKIAEGGMGVVYEARQANPRRTVALKVLRSALPSAEMLARFQHEAHILAQFRHPGIAHIYEANTAQIELARGITACLPYFAMELVEGETLRAFAEGRRLGLRERLELMVQLCGAVHHAHEKGVIHRDLKPDNVIVDASGRPRVLDFGVARLTAAAGDSLTRQTRAGDIVGTPAFMSPEQVGGDPALVDTRSDIYSLGVMLYELLTGKRPHDVSGLGIAEAAKRIKDDDPRPPGMHDSSLRGEIDWIVLRCLEKDPARRYSSAAALAEDIERFLRDEPVLAAPQSRAYRMRKLMRRHRGPFAAGMAIIVLLIAAVVGTTMGLLEAREQCDLAEVRRKDAEREKKTAQAVTRFLTTDLLGADSAQQIPGQRDERLSDVLVRAEQRVDSGALADEPVLEAALRNVLGTMAEQLGRPESAERHQRRGLELVRASEQCDPVEEVRALTGLGRALNLLGRLPESAVQYREALALVRAHGIDDPEIVGGLCNDYAQALTASHDLVAAEEMFREALRRFSTDTPRFRAARAIVLGNLSAAIGKRGDLDGAIATGEEALTALRAAYGPENPVIAITMVKQGLAYRQRGDLDHAEKLYREALAMQRKLLPPAHPSIAESLNNVAAVLGRRGDAAGAEPVYREALQISEAALPPGHYQTAIYRRNLGACLFKLQRFEEAEAEIGAAYQVFANTPGLPPHHQRQTMQAFVNLYVAWAKADPQSDAAAKASEWRTRLKNIGPTSQAAP